VFIAIPNWEIFKADGATVLAVNSFLGKGWGYPNPLRISGDTISIFALILRYKQGIKEKLSC